MAERSFALIVNRRNAIGGILCSSASLASPIVFPSYTFAQNFTNDPGETSAVAFGVLATLTGPFAREGDELLRGFELAVSDINGDSDGGMLSTLSNSQLEGTGVLGKKVEYVVADTQGAPDRAAMSARQIIQSDGSTAIMGANGTSSALAALDVATQAGVVMMAGSPTGLSLTGDRKTRFGFRHFRHDGIAAATLSRALSEVLSSDRNIMNISFDTAGRDAQLALYNTSFQNIGWNIENDLRLPLTSSDLSVLMSQIMNSDADTFVVTGGPVLANQVAQALDAVDLRGNARNGNSIELITPNLDRMNGFFVEGAIGNLNWHWSLADDVSKAFFSHFGSRYGFPPSQVAHTAYVQTLLYANAVQTGGTFRPEAVQEVLEGFEFSGTGNGEALYNGADHQVYQRTFVVRTKSTSSTGENIDILSDGGSFLCRCHCKGQTVCKTDCCSSEWDET